MYDVEVIEDRAAAAIALDPTRAMLLAELVEPASAGALAPRVGIARQKLNYHLKALEAHGDDLDVIAETLEVSRHGLLLRLRELGLRSG